MYTLPVLDINRGAEVCIFYLTTLSLIGFLLLQLTSKPFYSVVNFSSSPFSQGEIYLLSKGRKFWPTQPEVNQIALSQDLSTYYRRIRLKEFFVDEPPPDPESLDQKSTWTPPQE